MSKNTKHVVLFNLLKSGEPCHINTIVSTLDCGLVTAMGYIFTLRNKFGADIATIRNGRKTEYYRIDNVDHVTKRININVNRNDANKIDTAPIERDHETDLFVDNVLDEQYDEHLSLIDLRSELGLGESYVE